MAAFFTQGVQLVREVQLVDRLPCVRVGVATGERLPPRGLVVIVGSYHGGGSQRLEVGQAHGLLGFSSCVGKHREQDGCEYRDTRCLHLDALTLCQLAQ